MLRAGHGVTETDGGQVQASPVNSGAWLFHQGALLRLKLGRMITK